MIEPERSPQPVQNSSYWILGDIYTFKKTSETTAHQYAFCEILVQPQSKTPLHIHTHEDEAFYVQAGTFEFQINQQTTIASNGTLLFAPKGQPHRFTNIGTQPGRLLCWVMPARLEQFFVEIGIPVADLAETSPTIDLSDIESMLMVAAKYGIHVISYPEFAELTA